MTIGLVLSAALATPVAQSSETHPAITNARIDLDLDKFI
jgi:hypothetical protein